MDNRPENLIWVTENDHRRIDKEFNTKLRECGKIIRNNAKKQLIEIFNKHNDKSFTGYEVCVHNHNIFCYVIRDTLVISEKEKVIKNLAENKSIFYDKIYVLNKSNGI